MFVFISVEENGEVTGVSSSSLGDSSVEIEVAEDHEVLVNPFSFKYIDGELTKDSEAEEALVEMLEEAKNRVPVQVELDGLKSVSSALLGGEQSENEQLVAMTLNKALQKFASTLPEEEALELAAMYPAWEPTKKYKAGDYVRHGLNHDGEPQVYVVLQKHDSQADWSPPVAVSLFKALGFTEDGTPTWVQPLGATDAYQKDDVVSFEGVLYRSTMNNNVWAPNVYGWVLEVASTPSSAKNKK